MTTFGFVVEGPTDQEIIENILTGYFENPDLLFNPLQPQRDATDKSRFIPPAGWHQVFEYCSSEDFKTSFQFNDYVVIQIDTDISEEKNVIFLKLKMALN